MSESRVVISAIADQAVREFNRFKAEATGSLKQVAAAGSNLNGMLASLGMTVSGAAFAGWIKGAIDAADDLNDLSATTKIAVSDLGGLQYAAKLTGSDLEATAKGINKLSVEMGRDAERFAKLGITAKEPLEAYKQFADVFAAIEDPQMRAALGAQVLGKSWEQAAPMLDEGSAGITALIEKGKQLNPVTDEMAAQAGILNDQIDELSATVDGFKTKLAADMLPAINDITGAVRDAYTESGMLEAAWVALGALGTFAFTDDFDSYQKKLANLREEIESLEDSRAHAAYVTADWGILGEILWGNAETWDTELAAKRQEMADLIKLAKEAAEKASADAKVARENAEKDAKAAREKAEAARRAAEFLRQQNAELDREKKLLAELNGLTGTFQAEWDALAGIFHKGKISTEQLTQAQAALLAKQPAVKASVDALAKAEKEAAEAAKLIAQAYDDRYDTAAKAAEQLRNEAQEQRDYNERLGLTKTAIVELDAARLESMATEAEAQAVMAATIDMSGKLADQYHAQAAALRDRAEAMRSGAVKEASIEAAEEYARAWEQANAQIGQSLTDAIMRGGKSALDYIKDYARTLVLRPIVQMITAPLTGAMAAMMPGYANAGTGGAGSIMDLANTGQSIYGAITGGFSTLSAAVADSVQAVMYQTGMTTQIASNGAFASQIGAAVPLVAAAVASYFGAKAIANGYEVNGIGKALNFLGLAGGVVNRLFGHKDKEYKSSTLAGHFGMSGNFTGGIHNAWTKEGGVFRSDDNGVDPPVALDPAMVAAFKDGYGALKAATADYAKALGLNADAIATRVQGMSITLTKDEEKNKQLIADFFSGVADTMAQELLPSVATFKQGAESASATLQRLATHYVAVDEVLRAIGMTFGATGVDSLEARERLVTLSGGIDKLAATAGVFAQEFLTEAERIAPVAAMVSAEMAKLGLSSVDTRDEFKAVVMGLDLTTEAGAKQYAALMSLAGAFAQVHPQIEATVTAIDNSAEILAERASLQGQLDELTMTRTQLLEKERNAIDASNRALFDQVQQARQAVSARESLAAAYEREQAAILSTQERMASFAGTLRNLHDNALLGSLSPLSPQQKYAEAKAQYEQVLEAARTGDAGAQAKYSEAYSAFLNASRTVNASGAAYQMDFAYAQNATAEAAAWAEAQVDVAEASLQALQAQVSGLITVNESVLSVGQAIQALAAAMGPAGAGVVGNSQTAVIQSLYQSLLGRAADQEGMQYWVGQMGKGVAIADIARAFSESAEYDQRNMLPVQSAAASVNYASMGTSAMAPLVSEIKALREDNRALRTEVAGLRADQQRLVSAQINAAFAAANSSADKIAAATKDAARETLQATESKVTPV